MESSWRWSPRVDLPGRAGLALCISLRAQEGRLGGRVYPDNVGFRVNLPGRESFSPDVAFHTGRPTGMKFLEGASVFAVGTRVVWDVDLLSEDVVRAYRATDPNHPTVYRRGEAAEAEPAVPGWRMPVDDLFD